MGHQSDESRPSADQVLPNLRLPREQQPAGHIVTMEKSRRCQERPRNRKHLLNHQPPQKRSQRNQWTQGMKILREIGKSSIVVRVG